jgi:hypothetical protein
VTPTLSISYLPRGYRLETVKRDGRWGWELRDCAGRLAVPRSEHHLTDDRQSLREAHDRLAKQLAPKCERGGFDLGAE